MTLHIILTLLFVSVLLGVLKVSLLLTVPIVGISVGVLFIVKEIYDVLDDIRIEIKKTRMQK